MNHRITLWQLQGGHDALNQPIADWTPVATVWADVRFQSGAEVLRAGADTSIVKASIRIRARADVDASWRATYGKWTFEIKGDPLPDKDPSFMFLVCEAIK